MCLICFYALLLTRESRKVDNTLSHAMWDSSWWDPKGALAQRAIFLRSSYSNPHSRSRFAAQKFLPGTGAFDENKKCGQKQKTTKSGGDTENEEVFASLNIVESPSDKKSLKRIAKA
ncbi:hypothetical protein L596_020454 [Steinernema carpocapsae]|uniref:Uncharacterized protein n=1 Tax=Steinernema carpocapsae TaxID=34508 RepID=A0A4U5MUC4_STECR|nr:hypothetical protein L596_020454 [Steinernema carpocapsae]